VPSDIDEITGHAGQVCPGQLPPAPPSTNGFGTNEPARFAPSLAAPESAWVCRYDPQSGMNVEWMRQGDQQPVPQRSLPSLADLLTELRPAANDGVCPSNIGPRWMLVYSIGTDLTAVVIDDYGCGKIRLTDDPFTTVPGDATQPGTVTGVLAGPADLLELIRDTSG
jgi:hypothetical protein